MTRMPGFQFIRDATFIFIAAACLGFAYNAASPLGVRWTAGAAIPASAADPPMPVGGPDPGIHNETLAAFILPDDPAAVRAEVGQKLPATMAWAEVKPLLAKGEIVLVDARDTLAYEAGHIPGAISLPVDAFNERIAAFTASIPKSKPLVFYCASIRCRLAHEAAVLLGGQFGYTDVREMPSGYAEWMVMEPDAKPATGTSP